MATNWLSNLLGGGGTSVYGTKPITSTATQTRYTPYQERTVNTYADRMTAMARYYRNAQASGVAQVRAIDNMQPAYQQNQNFLAQQRSNTATSQRYNAQAAYINQYRANALRGFNAAGQRLTGEAADWMAQNAFNFPQPQGGGNQYAGGGYGGYGYGDGGGSGGGAATLPDWYQSFLSPINWRI